MVTAEVRAQMVVGPKRYVESIPLRAGPDDNPPTDPGGASNPIPPSVEGDWGMAAFALQRAPARNRFAQTFSLRDSNDISAGNEGGATDETLYELRWDAVNPPWGSPSPEGHD